MPAKPTAERLCFVLDSLSQQAIRLETPLLENHPLFLFCAMPRPETDFFPPPACCRGVWITYFADAEWLILLSQMLRLNYSVVNTPHSPCRKLSRSELAMDLYFLNWLFWDSHQRLYSCSCCIFKTYLASHLCANSKYAALVMRPVHCHTVSLLGKCPFNISHTSFL